MTPRRRWGTPTDVSAVMAAHRRLSVWTYWPWNMRPRSTTVKCHDVIGNCTPSSCKRPMATTYLAPFRHILNRFALEKHVRRDRLMTIARTCSAKVHKLSGHKHWSGNVLVSLVDGCYIILVFVQNKTRRRQSGNSTSFSASPPQIAIIWLSSMLLFSLLRWCVSCRRQMAFVRSTKLNMISMA